MSTLDFSTKIGSKRFSNPIFTASGCASSGKELAQFFPLNRIGAVVTKSVMSKPRHGRPTPRMAETRALETGWRYAITARVSSAA